MADHKAVTFVTKTKYYELNKVVGEYLNTEKQEEFMKKFQDIFKYDPNKTTSTPEGVERTRKKREKLKAEGISTYISSGNKKYYEKKKLLTNS